MDAKAKPIRDILRTGDQYIIPLFQRYYSWKLEHWRRLCNDLRALLEAKEQRVHFLGPMVCSGTMPVPGAPPAFHLIDGQQRLTTVTLLLAAIRDEAAEMGCAQLAAEITRYYLIHEFHEDLQRFHVVPRSGDRQAFVHIVEGHWMEADQELQLCRAYRYLRRQVAFLARGDAEARLREIFHTVSDRLHLVVICIDGENPYEIFDSLNSTGLPLAESDLIRNYVFMQVPMKEQDQFHEQQWLPFETMFDAAGDDPELDPTAFYRDYGMRNGAYTGRSAAFQTYREQTKASGLTPSEQVKELVRFAGYYCQIQRPSTCADAEVGESLRALGMLDVGTATPLLLNLMERHGTGEIDKSALVGALADIASFVLRRAVCGDSTRTYGRWFVEAITAIKRDVCGDLRQYWLRRGWPGDAPFAAELARFPIYKREHQKCRLILERLEESFGHKEQVDLDKLTIEHVMPQTVGDDAAGEAWKAMLGEDWETDHATLLHTLGNLTLTGYNSELSNQPFAAKEKALLVSHVELNGYFAGVDTWDRQAIETRAMQLAKTVASLWPCPIRADYRALVHKSTHGLSAAKQFYVRYWRALEALLGERESTLTMVELPTSNECRFSVDLPEELGASLWAWQSRKDRSLMACFGIKGQRSFTRQVCEVLKEEAAGFVAGESPVEWHDEWPGLCFADRSGIDFRDEDDWEIQHNWLVDSLEELRNTLVPRVRALAEAIESSTGLTAPLPMGLEQLRREFWTALQDHVFQAGLLKEFRKTPSGTSFGFKIGRTGYWLSAAVRNWTEDVGHDVSGLCFALHGNTPEAREFIQGQKHREAELVQELGVELEWSMPEDTNTWWLRCKTPADFHQKEQWPEQVAWLANKLERFHDTFHPMIHGPSLQGECGPDGQLTGSRQSQLKFWTAFREYLLGQGTDLKPRKPSPQTWYEFAIGKAGYSLCAIAVTSTVGDGQDCSQPELRMELLCVTPGAWQFLADIKEQSQALQETLGIELSWQMQEGVKNWKVYCRTATDFRDQDQWSEQFAWLADKLERFYATFHPMIHAQSLAKARNSHLELGSTGQQQLDFWTGFREFLNDGGSMLKPGKPCPGNWYPFPLGKTDYCLAAIATVRGEQSRPELRVEFVCFGDDAHGVLIDLKDQNKKLEDGLGAELTWHMQEGLKKWKLSCHRDTDFRDQDQRPAQFAWLKEKLELFDATFRPMVLGVSSPEE